MFKFKHTLAVLSMTIADSKFGKKIYLYAIIIRVFNAHKASKIKYLLQ